MSKPEFLPTRKTLLSRLKDWNDDDSWRTFFNTYWKLIYGVALKSGLSTTQAEDVVQETVVAVARNIGTFRYDPSACSFKTWLMKVTRSRISRQYRANNRQPAVENAPLDDGSGTGLIERVADPNGNRLQALWDEEWERNIGDAAVQRVKQRIDAAQFQLFDFYVLKEWPVRKVAETFGVSVGRVYLAKHRVGKMIQSEIRDLERGAVC
jgi:RNA polymerase sigma factor (sigma-70 family)